MTIQVRHATPDDLPVLQELFVGTIKEICKKDYSVDQLTAWSASAQNTERWLEKIKNDYFLVAVKDQSLVGFGSLEKGEHIDFMYVHKDHQRQGIAYQLLQVLENEARRNGAKKVKANVSKTALIFFESKGFYTLTEQTLVIDSIAITNYKMEKQLYACF